MRTGFLGEMYLQIDSSPEFISCHATFISFLTDLFLVLQKVIFIISLDPSSEWHQSWTDTSIINYMPSILSRPLSSQNPPGGWTNSNKCLSPANKPPYWSLIMFLLNQPPSPNGHFPHHISLFTGDRCFWGFGKGEGSQTRRFHQSKGP